MKLTPLQDWVLIRTGEPSEKSTGGMAPEEVFASGVPGTGGRSVPGNRTGESRMPSLLRTAERLRQRDSQV